MTASSRLRGHLGHIGALSVAIAIAVVAVAATVPVGAVDAPHPLQVLVVGNSVAGTLTRGSPLAAQLHGLAARSGIELQDRTILACGISTLPQVVLSSGPAPNSCGGTGHWQQQWPLDVAAVKPDVVVVGAGDHDVYDELAADGSLVPQGSDAWRAQYSADVAEMFRVLRATGATVVALTPGCYGENTLDPSEPPIPQRGDAERVRAVRAVWHDQASRRRGVSFLDLDAAICPGGTSDPVLRPDGVHFSQPGADRLAPALERALRAAVRSDRRSAAPRG